MKTQVRLGNLLRDIDIQRTGPSEFRICAGKDRDFADAFELTANTYSILLNGRSFEVSVRSVGGRLIVRCHGREFQVSIRDPRAWRPPDVSAIGGEGPQQITAPMPGKVIRILVSVGDEVAENQGLLVVEAMKMQNEIRSLASGRVVQIFVKEGQAVASGEKLVSME